METDPIRAANRSLTEAEDAHLDAHLQYVETRRRCEVIALQAMVLTEGDQGSADEYDAAHAAMNAALDKERATRRRVHEADTALQALSGEWLTTPEP
ncbi:MAG TPA: hypothetical protein VK053_04670 [Jiangellaceae bacterium]|nr:hypothetical protein [Jiangellaceae bacterium]